MARFAESFSLVGHARELLAEGTEGRCVCPEGHGSSVRSCHDDVQFESGQLGYVRQRCAGLVDEFAHSYRE